MLPILDQPQLSFFSEKLSLTQLGKPEDSYKTENPHSILLFEYLILFISMLSQKFILIEMNHQIYT